jgi:hypothetical protein
MHILRTLFYISLFNLIPFFSFGQLESSSTPQANVPPSVSGKVLDKDTQEPLIGVTIYYSSTQTGTKTDDQGKFSIRQRAPHPELTISYVGYKTIKHSIVVGKTGQIMVLMERSQNDLQEVTISSGKRTRYRNKGNPAVELIQQVINHKSKNKIEDREYLQYDQYERIQFSLTDLSDKFLHRKSFKKYQFLLDTTSLINDKRQTTLPMYMSEKISARYLRKSPKKEINILKAHKEVDFSAYIDSAGLDMYLNRLYANFDIYENNIFLLQNEFLSPIANHAPEFYKFFITDTLKSKKLIEISFMPRNAGDLLFEGKLYITMDGRYAVKGTDFGVNKDINLNFVRSMTVHQEFSNGNDGKLYLSRSDIRSNFRINKEKGASIFGERTVIYSNYKSGSAMPDKFYLGANQQIDTAANRTDPKFWAASRSDTLSTSKAKIYANIDSLKTIPSFKRTMWITSFIIGGYGDLGPVQVGPIESLVSSNPVEGLRFRIGGRTTPKFNKSIYLEGYTAYGLKDKELKYYVSGLYSFNKTAPYRFPNNYLKASYQYDTDIPGQNFLIDKSQSPLASITRGGNSLWLYNRIAKLEYTRDLENHFTYNIGIRNWIQQPAGSLTFQPTVAPGKLIKTCLLRN